MRFLTLVVCLWGCWFTAQAQIDFSGALDSARAAEDEKPDTVIYTARYVRYTTLNMMKQGTYTYQIDTTHNNFHHYNPQNLPHRPSINLGSYGLATRDLLFEPNKTIGFQPGYRALERYMYLSDSVKYYRARAPFSELYNVGFFFGDQVLRAKITQNINPQLNLGAEFHTARTDGFYFNQAYGDLKASLFSWYESPNNRYNLLTNFVSNRLTSTENGSVLNDTLFRQEDPQPSESELTRLRGQRENRPRHTWRDQTFFLRQSLFVGRLDTVNHGEPEQQLLPTNRMSHSLRLRRQDYQFYKNEADAHDAFPLANYTLTEDTTLIHTITNDFGYSFYLRGNTLGFVKNEVKLDLGYQHDMIWYNDPNVSSFMQNNTLKAGVGYRFSDRVTVTADLNQIVQGQHFGDYLYEAQADVLLSKSVGRIVLGAYTQNKSPEMVYQQMNYTYHRWAEDFDKTKTTNLFFRYENPLIGFSGKAEYYLISNHMYFREVANERQEPALMRVIEPAQFGTNINLLKVTVGQNFRLGNFRLHNLAVYQQSDFNDVLAIPQLYTWHSLFYTNKLYKVVDFSIGLDARFNTPFTTPSYAINIGQFYNDHVGLEFSTYPIVDAWVTATVSRMNLFLSYNFVNQHLNYPGGYYTVRRYPMNNVNLRIGAAWKFYD